MNITEQNREKLSILEKIANGIIDWIGSVQSLIFHTLFFIVSFLLPLFNIVDFDHMLLVLTTIVSLEAIYLAIFIQMSVNKSSEHIVDLKEDIDEIQEDIDEIQEDIEEINEDIDEIQEDIEEINEEDDVEDPAERARTVMLKSKVSSNKSDIKNLKDKIAELEKIIEDLRTQENQ